MHYLSGLVRSKRAILVQYVEMDAEMAAINIVMHTEFTRSQEMFPEVTF